MENSVGLSRVDPTVITVIFRQLPFFKDVSEKFTEDSKIPYNLLYSMQSKKHPFQALPRYAYEKTKTNTNEL